MNPGQRTPDVPLDHILSTGIRHTRRPLRRRPHLRLGCVHPALASRGPGSASSCPSLQCRRCGLTFLPRQPRGITLGSLCGQTSSWPVCNTNALKQNSRISQPSLLSLAVAGVGLGHSRAAQHGGSFWRTTYPGQPAPLGP